MSYQTINEFLRNVTNSHDKISALKTADSFTKAFLYEAFAEWESFELPDGDPPYKQQEGDSDIAQLKLRTPYMVRQLQYLKKEYNISRSVREGKFISMLEGLHPSEAEFLIAVKDKRLHEMFPGLTRGLIDSTFPDLLILKV